MLSNNINGDPNWTEEVKKSLGQLGINNGLKVCAATKEREYETEWLYDLVWYKEGEEGFLIDVPLVVECEWHKNLTRNIKFDFEKLLLARSTIKLMICNGNQSQKNAFLEYFQKAVNVCPLVTSDDLYLIAILRLESIDAVEFEFFEVKEPKGKNVRKH